MMKLCVAVLLFSLNFPAIAVLSQSCVTGGFSVLVNNVCSYSTLLEAFKAFYAQPFNINPTCSGQGPEQILQSLLGVANAADGASAVASICQQGFASYNSAAFRDIPGAYSNDDFIKKFYNGGTDFNEHVATLFPPNSQGTESYLLSTEAQNIGTFFAGPGSSSMVKWPDYVPNFQQCTNNAAMCCWPQDRQANDGNGNCASPYDSNCVDADPGDNTDLCYTNFTASAKATGYPAANAGIDFPYDAGSNQDVAEGPIHCHGLGWADDVNDASSVYKGNNLFFISMYDHMRNRGYVRNIPGAPMCGCVEQVGPIPIVPCLWFDESHLVFEMFLDASCVSIGLLSS